MHYKSMYKDVLKLPFNSYVSDFVNAVLDSFAIFLGTYLGPLIHECLDFNFINAADVTIECAACIIG